VSQLKGSLQFGRFRFADPRFRSVSLQLDERPGFGRQLGSWNQIAGHLPICNRKSGLGECIGDNALIKKAATSQLAAITCPSNRLYGQVKRTQLTLGIFEGTYVE
jgi:hypothetical protein